MSETAVSDWLQAAGHRIATAEIAALRRGAATIADPRLCECLAQLFGLDTAFFTGTPTPADDRDTVLVEDLTATTLRRLGHVAAGLSTRALLYLETVAEQMRRSEHLPPASHTARP
ncbi:hypothetical protein D7D52_10215 [Nocardia yunnanensis]|uniref:XRE family transcriptional regulator n=1 Tax=Nocardia yunnanensis TaxID=2382165 RepID=A0A386Z8N2_9NOCA|nr:hypothetical protein [Nocardia yunnanensis]AYF74172.1 hypothetical protein D7D52_10215 [Nocardia yunnanensis]